MLQNPGKAHQRAWKIESGTRQQFRVYESGVSLHIWLGCFKLPTHLSQIVCKIVSILTREDPAPLRSGHPSSSSLCASKGRLPLSFFFRRPLPFGGSHLRLLRTRGIRTTTGSLSALARPTPYQLSHRIASKKRPLATVELSLSQPYFEHFFGPVLGAMMKQVCWHSRRSEAQ